MQTVFGETRLYFVQSDSLFAICLFIVSGRFHYNIAPAVLMLASGSECIQWVPLTAKVHK